jgi:hypothetical protein
MYKISFLFSVVFALIVGCSNIEVFSDAQETDPIRTSQLDTFSLFNYAMFANDSLFISNNVIGGRDLKSNGVLIVDEYYYNCIGNAFASTKILVSSSSYLTGNASSPEVDYLPGHITGSVNLISIPVSPFPEIDTMSFYNVASANSQVFPGGYTLNIPSNGTYTIPGGVMYVQGNVNISTPNRGNRGSTLIGCIVASGNVNIGVGTNSGVLSCTKSSVTNVILLSINGNIANNTLASATYNGLIYANNGSYTHSNQGTINLIGLLVVNGKIKINYTTYKLTYQKMLPKIN